MTPESDGNLALHPDNSHRVPATTLGTEARTGSSTPDTRHPTPGTGHRTPSFAVALSEVELVLVTINPGSINAPRLSQDLRRLCVEEKFQLGQPVSCPVNALLSQLMVIRGWDLRCLCGDGVLEPLQGESCEPPNTDTCNQWCQEIA
eukprot:gene4856-882_t